MVARITTFAFDDVEAQPVDMQVQLSGGQVAFTVVGLPDKAVSESRERVRAAFAALGRALPPKRVIVNLAPADLPKEGSHYDLAIALAMLAKLGVIPEDQLAKYAAIGELSLDGRDRHLRRPRFSWRRPAVRRRRKAVADGAGLYPRAESRPHDRRP